MLKAFQHGTIRGYPLGRALSKFSPGPSLLLYLTTDYKYLPAIFGLLAHRPQARFRPFGTPSSHSESKPEDTKCPNELIHRDK